MITGGTHPSDGNPSWENPTVVGEKNRLKNSNRARKLIYHGGLVKKRSLEPSSVRTISLNYQAACLENWEHRFRLNFCSAKKETSPAVKSSNWKPIFLFLHVFHSWIAGKTPADDDPHRLEVCSTENTTSHPRWDIWFSSCRWWDPSLVLYICILAFPYL